MAVDYFDLKEWEPRFTFRDKHDLVQHAYGINGPASVVALERIREILAPSGVMRDAVPVDVHVLCLGECPWREGTKIGGLPYRLAEAPWPVRDGTPMTFVAQFNLAASREILPRDVPGDVLLIFADSDNRGTRCLAGEEENAIEFEWQRLGIPTGELVQSEQIPESPWKFVTCYGLRHRTMDYRHCDATAFRAAIREVDPDLRDGSYLLEDGVFGICRSVGMKIGGAPFWVNRDGAIAATFERMMFLCSLSAVYPMPEEPFPWANHPEQLPVIYDREEMTWDIGDSCIIHVFVDKKQRLRWAVQYS